MFQPVPARPDLVALEHGVLAQWRERATFSRLRAQNAGGKPWSFLDGPITANNPMGVHHAWGRTYKDLFQRFHAMLGEDQRWQNGFDCQGLWVEVNVERDLGFTSKRDIEAYGIAEFVSLCKQRVLTFAARQTEQSVRLGMWMDWNDPDELRRLRDLLAADPAQTTTIQGPARPDHRYRRAARGSPRDARRRWQLLHVQQREQRPDLGLPAGVQQARLDLQGPRLDAVVPALRHRHQPARDDRGLPGSRGPGADGSISARRPPGRGAPRLDHDALDARARTSRPRSGRTSSTSGSARPTQRSGSARARSSSRCAGHSRCSSHGRAASWSGGATRARSMTSRPCVRRSRRAPATRPRCRTSIGSSRGPRSARTRAPASSTSRRAPARRTSSSARASGSRRSGRSTRAATTTRASAG